MSAQLDYELLEPAEPIELRQVEQELLALRHGAKCSTDEACADDQPITRACMSNLIVYCDTPEEADTLPEQFALMARHHPARIIVLVGHEPGTPPESMVRVQAGLTQLGKRRQVSSEQIRIHASSDDHNRLASAARPLLIGDLPTALWWNSNEPPARAGPLFDELQEMAGSVVYDSRGWRDPRGGLIATANWVLGNQRCSLVADLAWMRLRLWRRFFGEALAPHVLPGALQRIELLTLEHGPHALALACLFIGWLAHALGWRPVGGQATSAKHLIANFQSDHGPVRVEVERRGEGPADLRRAVVKSRAGGTNAAPLSVEFEALDRERIAIRVDDDARGENIVSAPDEPRVVTLAWQLANRTGQPEFRQALEVARDMARE
ncbi:MAG: glucose-6-phosphate dehydrogenase assembly protein OpcA, partial [bacterium]|nr:glucose-6-phosphate dehydrogenase assembly protein OpcA [bacterium]